MDRNIQQQFYCTITLMTLLCFAGTGIARGQEPAADDSVFVAATVLDIKIFSKSVTPKEIADEIHTKVAYHIMSDWAIQNNVKPTREELQELFANEAKKIPKEFYETEEGMQRVGLAVGWAKGSAIDWVTAKALHEKFGGRIAVSSFGAYTAIEGRNAVLKEYAAAGKIKFHDSEIEKYFWERISSSRVLDVTISDPKRIASRFAKPPWEGWGAQTTEILKREKNGADHETDNKNEVEEK
jgi:hypothetical protein